MSFKQASFDAIGPTVVAFETLGNIPNSGQVFGVSVTGSQCGVYGESSLSPVGTRPSTTDVPEGTGVAGRGEKQGVKGVGDIGVVGEGRLGVFGSGNPGPGIEGHSFVDDGVVGRSDAEEKSGVFGFNAQEVGTAFGVFGTCNAPDGSGVGGDSSAGVGVRGHSGKNDGVVGLSDGQGKSGIFGFNSNTEGAAFGVFGRCDSAQGAGVSGQNDSTGDAVSGFSPKGVAVRGTSQGNDGVVGHSETRGKSGVFGENTSNPDPKIGGLGISTNIFGVTGRANAEIGIGIFGDSANGTGVSGNGGTYGAILHGGRAPLRLVPASDKGAPASGLHFMGELYVDSEGSLFFCKSNGIPGTWVTVA